MNEDMYKDEEMFDDEMDEEEEREGDLTVSDNFGIMLRHYRKIKNLSLKQLEELSGVSFSYICRLEKGEKKSPSITKILQLSEALQIPNSVLIATIIKEPRKPEKIELFDLLIRHNYLLNGEELSREAKERLLKIFEYIAKCSWSPSTKVRDIFVLSELIDQFKQAV